MTASAETRDRRAALLVALFLLASALATAQARLSTEEPIDFYHFWGIQAARALAPEEDLGGPYAEGASYAAVLNAAAERSDEPALRRTNARRRALDPTAPPLAYFLCAWLPTDWGAARRLYVLAQLGAFAAGTVLLVRELGLASVTGILVAAGAAASFVPLQQDLALGNVNAFQLAGVALAIVLARRDGPAGRATLPLCALIALAKPNQLPAAALVALARLARAGGPRARLLELGLGALAGLFLGAAAAAWFRDADVWGDWYHYLLADDPHKLTSYPVERGMIACSGRLAARFGGEPYAFAAGLFAVVALGFAAAAARARRGGAPLLRDPATLAAFGVVASAAAGPLAWFHYHVLALVPGLVLVLGRPRLDVAAGLGALGLALVWGPLLAWPGGRAAVETLVAFAWVAFLAGLVLRAGAPAEERAAS